MAALTDFLKTSADAPVRIDCAKTMMLTTPCLQLLLSAQRDWAARGIAFQVVSPSPAFEEHLVLLGLDATHFHMEGSP